jgi:hypothetical protein
MSSIARGLMTLLLLIVACSVVFSQGAVTRGAAGSISGRVMIDSRPVPDVTVQLRPDNRSLAQARQVVTLKVTTDLDGKYHFSRLESGNYLISFIPPPELARALVRQNNSEVGVALAEGEIVRGIDFALMRGGSITGRVVDANGLPIGRAQVAYRTVEDQAVYQGVTANEEGVYQVTGIHPGKYVLVARGRTLQRSSYYESVKDSEGVTVEVEGGSILTGIDLRLASRLSRVRVTGRAIDGETGEPVSTVSLNFSGTRVENDGTSRQIGGGSFDVDAAGGYVIEGVIPGHYKIGSRSGLGSEKNLYSEPATFDVTEGDLAVPVIRLLHGASIRGMVIVEDTDDPAILSQLKQIEITGWLHSEESPGVGNSGEGTIDDAGRFQIVGLPPGRGSILVRRAPLGFGLLRIERDGIEVKNISYRPKDKTWSGGIELGLGEQVSGVRVVFGYGTGSIRGQVKIANGELRPGSGLRLIIRRGQNAPFPDSTLVDARGRFLLKGLVPGDYVLQLMPQPYMADGVTKELVGKTYNVNVINDVETPLTIELDLSEKTGHQ